MPLFVQTFLLLLLLTLGAVVCAAAARTVTVRYRLPWREALVYFGLAPDPRDH